MKKNSSEGHEENLSFITRQNEIFKKNMRAAMITLGLMLLFLVALIVLMYLR